MERIKTVIKHPGHRQMGMILKIVNAVKAVSYSFPGILYPGYKKGIQKVTTYKTVSANELKQADTKYAAKWGVICLFQDSFSNPYYTSRSGLRMMMSSRPGPLETIAMGASISFSTNSIYLRQFSGSSS